MNKLQVMVVRDRAADVFGTPFFAPTIGGAIRSFADEINTPREGNTLHNHPNDFDLYHLGEYQDETADFTMNERPRQVAIGKDLVQRLRNDNQPELPLGPNGASINMRPSSSSS